jgi:hypothetical protein
VERSRGAIVTISSTGAVMPDPSLISTALFDREADRLAEPLRPRAPWGDMHKQRTESFCVSE